MDASSLSALRAWLTEAGLMGTSESALLRGFAERAVAAGVPLARATALIDTLHPVHEGRVFRWRADGSQVCPIDVWMAVVPRLWIVVMPPALSWRRKNSQSLVSGEKPARRLTIASVGRC
jgi:hypothetical protein